MASKNGFTPTEQKILKLLSDGRPHTRDEVYNCLWDEQSNMKAIYAHICRMRPKLLPKGEDIVCVIRVGTAHYQHIKLLTPLDSAPESTT